ncbi:hypothetical protein KP509_35G014800 [Ceratopteris richardii]|nr:hypothetical protein KP509_35G014800 [Ceratopteris richardii]
MSQELSAADSGAESSSDRISTKTGLELEDDVKKNVEVEVFNTIGELEVLEHVHKTSLLRPEEVIEGIQVCRVCQCADLDPAGKAALKSLDISFPSCSSASSTTGQAQCSSGGEDRPSAIDNVSFIRSSAIQSQNNLDEVPYISDSLIELGCACRGDLSLAHYACALRWFISRTSLLCEICGTSPSNIKTADYDKVVSTLQSTYDGVEACSQGWNRNPARGVLPLEVVSWFDPCGNLTRDRAIDIPVETQLMNSMSPATKWAAEGTGILIATGLLTVTITWLLTPHLNKGAARRGSNVLIAGICALTIVMFLRFCVLPRIKYGPARYWAILIVFWFLIFGVWASSTRTERASP